MMGVDGTLWVELIHIVVDDTSKTLWLTHLRHCGWR